MSSLRVPEAIRSMGVFQFVTRSPARTFVTMAILISIYLFFFSPLLNSSMPIAISLVVFLSSSALFSCLFWSFGTSWGCDPHQEVLANSWGTGTRISNNQQLGSFAGRSTVYIEGTKLSCQLIASARPSKET